jgi:hypothetical protein
MTLVDIQQTLQGLFRDTGAVVLSYAMRLCPPLHEQSTEHWVVNGISFENYPAYAETAYTSSFQYAQSLARLLTTTELTTALEALDSDLAGVRQQLESYLTGCTQLGKRRQLADVLVQYAIFIVAHNNTVEGICRELITALDACLSEQERDSSLETFGVLAITVDTLAEGFFLK